MLQEVIEEGFLPDGVSWRDIDGNSIASLSTNDLPKEDKIVCLPLNRLTKILMNHIRKQANAEVRWSHKVLPTIGQDQSSAWVMVETPNGIAKISADYIVGCDGANSQIRKSLFGDWEFPGRTWDEQIVATNVSPKILGTCARLIVFISRSTTTCLHTIGKTPISSSTKNTGTC